MKFERLNKLKRLNSALASGVRAELPLHDFLSDRVSSSGLTIDDIGERLDKIAGCASIVELKEKFVPAAGESGTMEQQLSISAANYCKQHAVCPVCADRSQSRRRVRFDVPIKKQAEMVRDGARHAYIITYTVTDGESLSERLTHLKASYRNFRLMGQKRGRRGRSIGEAGKIRAGISTAEIKRGENSGQWHCHIHELAFTETPIDFEVYDREKRRDLNEKYGGKWIPKEELSAIAKRHVDFNGESVAVSKISDEWYRATGGDSLGISVEPIGHIPKNCNEKKRRKYRAMSFVDSVAAQAREVLKYISKPSDNSPSDMVTIIEDTYNRRLVATVGEFRGIPGDDYVDPAGEDDNTYLITWNAETGAYGDVQPGRYRDTIEEIEGRKARSICGKLTGQYRRLRRSMISKAAEYGTDLHRALNSAKYNYRSQICRIWSMYRQAVESAKRMLYTDCDKYSPVLAAAGIFLPGSDSHDIYAAAF